MRDLIERARTGDEATYADLVRNLQDGFYRTAWAVLGSDADADGSIVDEAKELARRHRRRLMSSI